MVWIERVGGGIGVELTKQRVRLGNYMAKFEQQVREGRGITYSKGWPRVPENPLERVGRIEWVYIMPEYPEAGEMERNIECGVFEEISPGEYSICGLGEFCDCFQYAVRGGRRLDSVHDILSHRIGSSGGLDKQETLV